MTISTIVLAACAIVAMVMTHYDNVDQNKETKRSIEVADKNHVIQNRAYLVPKNPKLLIVRQMPCATVQLFNAGRTPAYRFGGKMQFECCAKDSTSQDPRRFVYIRTEYNYVLAPGDSSNELIKADSLHWKKNGRYYLYGKMWYYDFCDSLRYITFA
jgi:hypothetical protein